MNKLQTIQKLFSHRKTLAICSIALVLILGVFAFDYVVEVAKPIEVVGTYPVDNDISTILKGDLASITFSKQLSDSDKKNISTSINPQVTYTQKWRNNIVLILTNQNNDSILELNKKYNLTILLKNKLLKNISFTTSTYYSLDPNQRFNLFKEGQSEMQQEVKRISDKRPWVTKLPISKPTYVVFWDDTQETIRVQLYIKAGGLNTQQKIQAAKKEIQDTLSGIGISGQEKITYQELNI